MWHIYSAKHRASHGYPATRSNLSQPSPNVGANCAQRNLVYWCLLSTRSDCRFVAAVFGIHPARPVASNQEAWSVVISTEVQHRGAHCQGGDIYHHTQGYEDPKQRRHLGTIKCWESCTHLRKKHSNASIRKHPVDFTERPNISWPVLPACRFRFPTSNESTCLANKWMPNCCHQSRTCRSS